MSTAQGTIDGKVQGSVNPLLLSAGAVGQLLGVSLRQVWAMHQTGALGPLPVKLGARTLWQRAEIERWVEAGCPHRERWIDMRKIVKLSR